ncbi:MAG: LptF/LptG family permease [Phyllobacteriaceae bacterium]|nr:LptF/LptG family permease [Phyllobacteriaceae bacterium]
MRPGVLESYMAVRQAKAMALVLGIVGAIVVIIDFASVAARASQFPGFTAPLALASTILEMPTHLFVILPLATIAAAMGAVAVLAQRGEITVLRAAGLSPWRILAPAAATAFVIGVAVTAASPLTAAALSRSRAIDVDMSAAMLQSRLRQSPQWFAQSGGDGLTVIGARRSDFARATLSDVVFLRFDAERRFVERLDAGRAEWSDGAWHLERATRSHPAAAAEPLALAAFPWQAGPQVLARGFADVQQIGVFDLPAEIDAARSTGMASGRQQARFHGFLALPFLLAALAMTGGAVSLRLSGRAGAAMLVGAGLALSFAMHVTGVIFNALAVVGALPALAGAWFPVAIVALTGALIIINREEIQGSEAGSGVSFALFRPRQR